MNTANACAALCDWLAGVFAAPVPLERLEVWRSTPGSQALAGIAASAHMQDEVAAVVDALGTGEPEVEAAGIAAAHALLFSGAGGPATVAPYESVHASPEGLMFQRPAGEMAALLRRLDLAAIGLPGEPPDHLSVQLALLAELLRRGDHATAALLLDDHLLPWVPGFAELCRRHDRHGLYAAAAALLPPLLLRIRALSVPDGAFMDHEETVP